MELVNIQRPCEEDDANVQDVMDKAMESDFPWQSLRSVSTDAGSAVDTSSTTQLTPREVLLPALVASPQGMTVKNTFLHIYDEEPSCGAACRSASAPAGLRSLRFDEGDAEASGLEEEDEDEAGGSTPSPPLSPEELAELQRQMWIAHDNQCCKPCLYFVFKADSCRKGDGCSFCHRCTRDDVLARRKQQKQARRAKEGKTAGSRTRTRARFTSRKERSAAPLTEPTGGISGPPAALVSLVPIPSRAGGFPASVPAKTALRYPPGAFQPAVQPGMLVRRSMKTTSGMVPVDVATMPR